MTLFGVFDELGKPVGMDGQELRFALSLLGVYPISILFRLLPKTPNDVLKHIYSTIVGFGIAFLCFEWDALHFLAATVLTYLIMILSRKHCGWIAFAYNLSHLTWGNYDRLVNDYLGYSLNWTLPQMMLCCKLVSLAWNYADGQLADGELNPPGSPAPWRSHNKLSELPSLLSVLSYAFFFAGFLTGPWCDYREFTDFVDLSLFNENGGNIPNCFKFLLKQFACIGLAFYCMKLQSTYPVLMTTTEEFLLKPFWLRCALHFLVVELFYAKYYVAWWLGEGACAVIGLSFNGFDQNKTPRWDRLRMVDLYKFKLGTSVSRDVTPAWNIPSQIWLKRYVYVRFMGRKWSSSASRFFTFFVSAVWHGLYPGYFIFFISSAIFVETGILLRKTFWPLITEADGMTVKYPLLKTLVYDMGARLLITGSIDYLALAFQLMSWQRALKAFQAVHWVGHWILLFFIVLFFITRPLPCYRRPKKAKDATEAKDTTKTSTKKDN